MAGGDDKYAKFKEITGGKIKPRSRIMSGADFIAGHVPPAWLIDGIIQRSRLYSCTSMTGHGKTAVWLYNGCMINAGRMIGNLEVFPSEVLILAGENPADLEARMIGMALAYKLPHDSLPYVLPSSFPMDEEHADNLKQEIEALKIRFGLIIGDTAASFFPGDDDNQNVQAFEYARTLRSFTHDCAGNPAVVALCHPIKNATKHNLLPRGGGAFLNEMDGNPTLWSDNPGDTTSMHWQGKIRGPDFAPVGYRLRNVPTGLIDERDRPEMTVIAEPMSEEAVANHAKQSLANEDVVLRALRDHPGKSFSAIAKDAGWVDDAGIPLKAWTQRAIANLARDKLVEQRRTRGPWMLTQRGRKILDGEE